MTAVPIASALGVGGLAIRWWDRAPGEGLRALSADEYEFAQAFAEAWMPPGGVPAISGSEANLGAFLDELLANAPERERRLLKLLMQALDDLTIPSYFASFRNLPVGDRTTVLRAWRNSDTAELRGATQGLLLLLAEGYTTHPDALRAMEGSFACGYGR